MEKEWAGPNPAIQFAAKCTGPFEHPILRLQRTVGNQAVLRWLRPRAAAPGPEVQQKAAPPEQPTEPLPECLGRVATPALMIGLVAYVCFRIVIR